MLREDPMEIADEEAQPQQALPPQLNVFHNFGNPYYSQRWDRFQNRPIVTGRSVILERDNEQRALLVDYMTVMGWDALMELSEVIYPHAVRLFYNNLTMVYGMDGPIIRSYVLGKDIKIDRTFLKCAFELEEGDSKVHFTTDEELKQVGESIDSDTGLQQIVSASCHTRTTPGQIVKNDLKPEYHILHLWLRHNILTAKGHLESVTPYELYLFYCCQEGVLLDLPTIILNEMIKIHQTDRRALGYGALLTHVFQRFNVDLTAEVSIPISASINRYTIGRSRVLEMLTKPVVEEEPDVPPSTHPEAPAPTEDPPSTFPSIPAVPTCIPDPTAGSTSTAVPPAPIYDPSSSTLSSSSGGFRRRTTAQLEEVYRMLEEVKETQRNLLDSQRTILEMQRVILERLPPPPPSQP